MPCSELDLAYLRQVVQEQSSNVVESSRDSLFDMRLTPMARLAGASTLGEFVGLLRMDNKPHLHRAVAEAMTINETSFFRDGAPFEMLRETILPQLIERRSAVRCLRIWSAASSTGQEAYSLAMLLREHFPILSDWDVQIVGTDISEGVLTAARLGRYRRLDVNRGLPARMLVKYLAREGDSWEMAAEVRGMCKFVQANLCAPLPKLPVFDLVLLRNVLLYLPPPNRTVVFRAVYEQMASDGFLLLGNAEQAEDSTKLFGVKFASNCYFYQPIHEVTG